MCIYDEYMWDFCLKRIITRGREFSCHKSKQDAATVDHLLLLLAYRDIFAATTTTTVTTTTSRTTTSRTTIPTTSSSTFTSSVANFPIERECGTCRCGLINTLHKIVGGQETRIHQYPWMAVVLIHERFYCAGSLINDLYVLTAAHCVEGVPVELLSLRLLEHNRSHPNVDLLVQRSVSQVRVHELYNSRTFDHDIALLRLNEPVDVVGLHLRPICLPLKGHSFDHELAIVTGWGAQTEAGFASETLQEVDVLVIPQSDCRNATAYKPGQITDNMLCAGQLDEGGKDACGGDSGGPLQVTFAQMPGQYQLAGIVSWGVGCARPNTPGVYTRVGQYLRWLSANTPGACHCTPYTEEYY
ncbi:transmembrane protease serine 6 [Drosophila obscura]|uniref:transmembrane protease serine 6 n=1 Tax=Drosophila obscura TaxID=7282 RepID=UPI001BB2809E|nr:transmembrane protease serine 6 [Drosophila obscura]